MLVGEGLQRFLIGGRLASRRLQYGRQVELVEKQGLQLLGGNEDGDGESKEYGSMLAAVRTILIADLVMSLDNVIAVAATAQGNMVLLILVLAISIPLVIFGSTLMIKLMERFPIIITLGAALIGWVAGETVTSDSMLHDFVQANPWAHYAAAAIGAVVFVGKMLAARSSRQSTASS